MTHFKDTPPWTSISPPTAQLPHSRDKLRKVINELDVENAARYKAGNGKTFCNIFVADVLEAMGLYPHHRMQPSGEPSRLGATVYELTANDMARWLAKHGARFGWVHADRKTATDAAERGHTVVVTWDSHSGRPGHIAVMLAEGTIAQAGRVNFVGRTIREGFGALPVEFWIQSQGGSHSPTAPAHP